MSFFFQAEDGIRDHCVTGVLTCAHPIWRGRRPALLRATRRARRHRRGRADSRRRSALRGCGLGRALGPGLDAAPRGAHDRKIDGDGKSLDLGSTSINQYKNTQV